MKIFKSWPLSVLILGAYPVIYTYSINLGSINGSIIVTPLLAAVAAAIVLNLICAIGMRSLAKGALVADFILFSTYLSTSLIETLFPWIYESPLNKPVACTIIILILAGAWGLGHRIRRVVNLPRLTGTANLCSLLLIVIPILQIGLFYKTTDSPQTISGKHPGGKTFSHTRPDVYYIIVDGYTREDVLADDMGYDNSPFINFLRKNGFYVAHKSRSNYAYTYLSLASSLNMDYISELNMAPDQEKECIRRIQASNVARLFHANGYRMVRYTPNWLLQDRNRYSETTFNPRELNEFENIVLKRFWIRPFLKQGMEHMYKLKTLYILDHLKTISKDPRANFIFAHILCPHPPFVFDRGGNMPEPQIYAHRPPGSHDWYPKESYVDQIDYLNRLLEETITVILKNSKVPPIIILQGDHGAACDGTSDNPSALMVRERISILNAYLVPIDLRPKLYASISPVNTFRLLGNYLFHIKFDLLPDRSYYSGPMDDTPYEFTDVKKYLPEDRPGKP